MEQVGEIAKKIPLVIISNREKVQVDAINQDNTKVGRLMARHLLDYTTEMLHLLHLRLPNVRSSVPNEYRDLYRSMSRQDLETEL